MVSVPIVRPSDSPGLDERAVVGRIPSPCIALLLTCDAVPHTSPTVRDRSTKADPTGRIALGLAALAMVATLPGRTQGVGLVTAPLLEDLHLDQLDFARWNLWATLLGAMAAVPAGWLVDRFGVRRGVPLFELLLAASVLTMAWSQSALGVIVGLVGTRTFGQSGLSIASLATVGKWFRRRVERAMGAYALALGLGFVAAFPGVQAAVELHGWRAAWSGVAIALVGIALLTGLLLRDGRPADDPEMQLRDAEDTGGAVRFARALRSPAFWACSLAAAAYAAVAAGTGLFTELMLRERGLGSDVFRIALATTALVGIAANFVGGLLAARRSLTKLLGVATFLVVPCLVSFAWIQTTLHAVLWAAALGAAGGLATVVFFALYGKVFGPTDLGKIQGTAQVMTVVGSALGPLAFAFAKDHYGSYEPAFFAFVPLLSLLALACVWVRPPSRDATA